VCFQSISARQVFTTKNSELNLGGARARLVVSLNVDCSVRTRARVAVAMTSFQHGLIDETRRLWIYGTFIRQDELVNSAYRTARQPPLRQMHLLQPASISLLCAAPYEHGKLVAIDTSADRRNLLNN